MVLFASFFATTRLESMCNTSFKNVLVVIIIDFVCNVCLLFKIIFCIIFCDLLFVWLMFKFIIVASTTFKSSTAFINRCIFFLYNL